MPEAPADVSMIGNTILMSCQVLQPTAKSSTNAFGPMFGTVLRRVKSGSKAIGTVLVPLDIPV